MIHAWNDMIRLQRTLRPATLGLMAAAVAVWAANGAEAAQRVVAVGDIHGDIESVAAILRKADLIDEDRRWIGQRTTLVQTGDFLDRGPADLEVMDLLRSLQSQAAKSGGKVIVLLGNHEAMNLMRDFRYVSAESFAELTDETSERRREDAYDDYVRFLKKRAKRRGEAEPMIDESFREKWMTEHPPGYLERIKALEGSYGKWLRRLPIAVKLRDSVFLHGGIHPDLAALSLDDINRRVRKELAAFDDHLDFLVRRRVVLPFFSYSEIRAAATEELSWVRQKLAPEEPAPQAGNLDELADYAKVLEAFLSPNWMLIHPDGPLWFRGYAEWREEDEARLEALLESYQAKRFVVGHTPVLRDGIQERFGGKAFLIDTGMLSAFYPGGRASALEIQGGRVRPIYLTPSKDGESSKEGSFN